MALKEVIGLPVGSTDTTPTRYYEIRCSTALGVNPKDATQGAHEVAPRAITNPINVRMPLVV
ncbi:uncharacterized protein PADG_11768 [Paracoccidioides brasiliensis Pb18]|uniref:Uncharacterized protein n=1 Tax=Paracoccidioides brasiliensis (strain Pb18) TaxID=502780 RepID=A0A0A0HY15_PARBD|nr:uncharacterized protein PADG_11768 [Paracoccidioides brasiliensis Pb18]KGM92230.1 hypothetical protein PADG_11768 [Paracoccidioides brasiliensis Pb18]